MLSVKRNSKLESGGVKCGSGCALKVKAQFAVRGRSLREKPGNLLVAPVSPGAP